MTMEFTDIVESYTASLVREYLHRKGLKTTLNALDQEFPRDPLSINSTSSLIRGLKMENVIKRNKCSKRPYRSILEVIVHHVKMNRKITAKKHRGIRSHIPPTLLTLSHLKSIHNLLNENGHGLDFLTLIKLYCGCLPLNPKRFSCLNRTKYNVIKNPHSSSGKQNGIKRDENGEPSYEFDDKFYYEQKEPQLYSEKEASTLTEKENVLKSFILGKNPSATSELSPDSIPISPDVVSESSEAENTSSTLATNNKRTLNTDRSTSPSTPSKSLKNCVKLCISDKQHSKANETVSFNIPSIIFSGQDVTKDENNDDSLSSDNLSEPNKEMVSETELVIQDINQSEEKCSDIFESYSTGPLIDDTSLLKKILLANNKTISKKWLGEAFSFSKFPSYGMIQNKEGCSGIIASVNAYLVKELLFNETKTDVEYLRPNQSQLESALVKAMTEILWQAGENTATIAMLQNKKEVDTMENIIDMSLKKTFSSKGDLQEAIMGNISQFTQTDGHGCILFLISTILSRGVKNVIDDMNGVSSLISTNGFSTLELVNLLLTGRAVSNVFDNNIKLKYSTIKGIAKRSDIGYLSIKEHFKCCKVGSYLKTPRFPVWVVHNENHFTILFSCQKQLISDWKVERKFILYYYDSLKNLGDEIKLVIDTTQSENSKNDQDILKTSVEHCIRTKWKDANIKWK